MSVVFPPLLIYTVLIMKTVFICLCAILCLVSPVKTSVAYAEDLSYAQILSGATLYSDEALTLPITSLPETYFVLIISEGDTVSRVSYLNLNGFIDNSTIERCDFTPKYKYAEATLTLTNDGGIINIRSAPDHTADNVSEKLTDGTTLEYYGSVTGSTQNQIIGDLWYAVRLSGGKLGYVYSLYAVASPIPDNVIEAEPEPEYDSPTQALVVDEQSSYFLIGALCMPVIVITYLLFKQKPNETNRS